MTPRVRLAAALAAATMLAACGSDAPAPPTAGTVPAAPAAIATASSDALRTRAGAAMAARRFFAPAGDNAAELLLELRERGRSEGGDAAALTELQPYLVIAAEQAVERRDAAEAQRLVDLLARIDADAPAIPRLRTAVQEARTAVVVAVRATEAGSSTPDVAQGLAEPARATPPALRVRARLRPPRRHRPRRPHLRRLRPPRRHRTRRPPRGPSPAGSHGLRRRAGPRRWTPRPCASPRRCAWCRTRNRATRRARSTAASTGASN